MAFTRYARKVLPKINTWVNIILSDWQKEIVRTAPQLIDLYKLFSNQVFGGKGIRGTLVVLGFELADKKPSDDIFRTAAAFEILHASLLVHDDIIDQSPLRRGRPSLYKALGNNHYGISQAICLGDLGLYLAIRTLSRTNFKNSLKQSVMAYFTKVVLKTILGEMLDVECARTIGKKTIPEILTIHRLKTAHYTIGGPLSVGAILAGMSGQTLKSIAKFGTSLGLAFQIKDDILGVFGSREILGKSVTSDIDEGKNTLLVAYALKKGTDVQRRFINKHYGNGRANNQIYLKIQRIFEETGALDYSNACISKYAMVAKRIIPDISKKDDVAVLLWALADFLIRREK